jgi:hypothetical protein
VLLLPLLTASSALHTSCWVGCDLYSFCSQMSVKSICVFFEHFISDLLVFSLFMYSDPLSFCLYFLL